MDNDKKKNKKSFKSVGRKLSISELSSLAEAKNKDPLTIMSKALDKGINLGAKVVNAYNEPGGLGTYVYNGTPDNLAPLRGLKINKGDVYAGSSSYSTPSSRTVNGGYKSGSTTYNPIVLPGPNKGKNKKKGKSVSPYDGMDMTPSTPGVDPGPWASGYVNPNTGSSSSGTSSATGDTGTSTPMTGETASPTSYADAVNSYEGMTGGGSGLSGAMGLRRAFSRWRSQNRGTQGTNNFRRFLQIGAPNINLN